MLETPEGVLAGKSSPPSQIKAASLSPILERWIVAGIICAVLIATATPYLIGTLRCPIGGRFLGQISQVDDYCVYLSWIRQAADGHFFARNLFTTEPQHGVQFNVLFILLGGIVRLTGWSSSAVLQGTRIAGAAALLALVFAFYKACVPGNRAARLTALGFTAFGAGLGWFCAAIGALGANPVDIWQPEAFTFFTIYSSALSTISTFLIVATLFSLFRCEQTGRTHYAVLAGLAALLLGNIHTYDIGQTTAAWLCFLVLKAVRERSINKRLWLQSALALAIALPSVVYQLYVFSSDPIFHQRAGVGMWTPAPIAYIVGYGAPFLLAAWAIIRLMRKDERVAGAFGNRSGLLMTVAWMASTFAVIYLIPVPFQRRMVLGEHIPLSLLAGVGAVCLLGTLTARTVRIAGLCLLVTATSITNVLLVRRDIAHLATNRTDISSAFASPYLTASQLDILHWARTQTKPNATFIAAPEVAVLLPGYADRAVWMGHWSETPKCEPKIQAFRRFINPASSDTERLAFLTAARSNYLCFPNDPRKLSEMLTRIEGHPVPSIQIADGKFPFLVSVYRNSEYTVYAIPR